MESFVTRLQQQRGLIAYGTPYTGELCRHNVYLVISRSPLLSRKSRIPINKANSQQTIDGANQVQ